MRRWTAMVIALLWLWPLCGTAPAGEPVAENAAEKRAAPPSNPAAGRPVAVFPQTTHTFEPVLDGDVVMHSFVLQNRGDAVLDVQEVKTG